MVKWLDTDEPVKKEDIEHVEKEFGIRFPKDYAEYAMQNHGGVPDPNSFDFEGRKGAVFERLLSYDETQPHYILKVYHWIKTRLPRKVYPIGSDPFGNYICFSYRENESNPCIVFWDHEKASPKTAISYVCGSFSELISKLYEVDTSEIDKMLREEYPDLDWS